MGLPFASFFQKMVGPAAKRAAVAHLQAAMSLSERRACSIVGADRKMVRYRSSRRQDAELRSRLRDYRRGRTNTMGVYSKIHTGLLLKNQACCFAGTEASRSRSAPFIAL